MIWEVWSPLTNCCASYHQTELSFENCRMYQKHQSQIYSQRVWVHVGLGSSADSVM